MEVDEKEAVRLYRLAAKQGLPNAQSNLAQCLIVSAGHCKSHRHVIGPQCGVGGQKDLAEATRLFREAAKQGHPHALYSLGLSNYVSPPPLSSA